MHVEHLSKMTKGWFVGDFAPTALKTAEMEVAVKTYKEGEREEWHFHKIATELTCIVSGSAKMAGRILAAGDILRLDPGEGTSFEALADTVTVVVKHPSAKDDKYFRDN